MLPDAERALRQSQVIVLLPYVYVHVPEAMELAWLRSSTRGAAATRSTGWRRWSLSGRFRRMDDPVGRVARIVAGGVGGRRRARTCGPAVGERVRRRTRARHGRLEVERAHRLALADREADRHLCVPAPGCKVTATVRRDRVDGPGRRARSSVSRRSRVPRSVKLCEPLPRPVAVNGVEHACWLPPSS